MINLNKYFRFVSFMLIVTTFLPLAIENSPYLVGSFPYFWGPIWLLSLLLFKPNALRNKIIAKLLLYGLLVIVILPNIVWLHMDRYFINQSRLEFYYMLIWISVFYYYHSSDDKNGFAFLSKWAFVFIIFTAIMTIYVSSRYPTYARSLTSNSEWSGKALASMMGAGGYGFSQMLVCLFCLYI